MPLTKGETHGAVVTTRTTCPYCGVGCGVLAETGVDGTVSVRGDPEHPANFGRLCSKGSALAETLSLDDRLLHPSIDGEQVTWDAALDHVAQRFASTIAEHGPDSVAFYVSGQILTEDYYVANKLMKGYIGSANIDTNSRLCMASSVAGHRRAFGSDTVPGVYEDLDQADLVVLVGSNLAWCHPVLFQRLEAARTQRGCKIVVVDPRETTTCSLADMHLAIKPGADVALFNGLLSHLFANDVVDHEFTNDHTTGLQSALAAADRSLPQQSEITGIEVDRLLGFYALFAGTPRVVTVYSQGVNQSTTGTDAVNAIINCHLLTGRIGRPGMGPFSVTGQPNAMGGREVGGLSNMLAAHMSLEDVNHRRIVQQFWQSPRIASQPGLKAVDLFRAVGDGRIKALWIMATNPVDSMPEADNVRAALAVCPFVVVSDVACETDTTIHAHVLLPSLAWGEKEGSVTNSERRMSRQRTFLPPPGDTRADWWQMAEVGKRLGYSGAFDYAGPHEIFAEYARLTGSENNGTRDLDISAFGDVTKPAYDDLAPTLWPQPARGPAPPRFFTDGAFFTPDGRARFVPTPFRSRTAPSPAYPLILNTGRIRDQWHTMTRTAKTPRLMAHIGEPFVEIHPKDAIRFGLAPATLAEVSSPFGTIVVRVLVTDRQQPGCVFVPMHWTGQTASSARVDALVRGDVDPVSGQPGLKQMPVAVRPFACAWYGLAVTVEKPEKTNIAYWATSRVAAGWRTELASTEPIGDATAYLARLASLPQCSATLDYSDPGTNQHRCAAFSEDRLVGALFTSAEPVAVSRSWAAEQLQMAHQDPIRILAARGGAAARDRGSIVCACFDVGRNDIVEAIEKAHCSSVAMVGDKTKAGTNCGSCRSEVARLIQSFNKV